MVPGNQIIMPKASGHRDVDGIGLPAFRQHTGREVATSKGFDRLRDGCDFRRYHSQSFLDCGFDCLSAVQFLSPRCPKSRTHRVHHPASSAAGARSVCGPPADAAQTPPYTGFEIKRRGWHSAIVTRRNPVSPRNRVSEYLRVRPDAASPLWAALAPHISQPSSAASPVSQAVQAAGAGRHVHPAAGHRRLEHDRLAQRQRPQHLARLGRQAVQVAVGRAQEHLAVDQRRRRQHAVQQLAVGPAGV